ncbi:MAG: sulfatase-like hydrolase/transferase [Verrucomicrobiota bacterium]|nr:sulfatase-like hydrolase/transferase [Verrucomicrobiota bacterium]MEC8405506.1 sulfatase-like hydrolase/transferase [Verrucomicrobiota bacterium]MEC8649998.1 sulfatase-like hydrolase/transferase [Verrucomicrobiota bacterium]
MANRIQFILVVFFGAIAWMPQLFSEPTIARLERSIDRPNIVFILMDDLGKEWIGCYGAENIQTPNIDALAESGMKFQNAYSMPQCTPSRVCFMTGQYPFRNGWVNHWDVPRWGLGYFDWKKNPSVARVLQSAGYRTAAAGKWQLNDFREHPDAMQRHGFDAYCMWTGGETDPNRPSHTIRSDQRYWDPYIHTAQGSRSYPGEFGPDIYNRFLLDFIRDNKEQPFFVYYPMTLPHTPFTTTPLEPNAQGRLGKHKAMVRYIDHLIGQLVTQLEDLELRDNTLIIVTSDNGTVRSLTNTLNGREVRGGKTKTTENGVNAPFIVNCPSLIPARQTSDALIDFTDLLPTFADFAGATIEPSFTYDGVSLKAVFTGEAEKSSRDFILAMGSGPGVATTAGIESEYYFRDRVLRGARYKLFVGTDRQPEQLIDLLMDPSESINQLTNSELASVVGQFMSEIDKQPKKDQDPNYRVIKDYPYYRAVSNATLANPKQSQIHKVGYSNSISK